MIRQNFLILAVCFTLRFIKERNDSGSFLVTIILVALGYIGGQLPLYFVARLIGNRNGISGNDLVEVVERADFEAVGMSKNLTFFLLLLMFLLATIALYLGVKYIHRRNFLSIATARFEFDWSRVKFSLTFWVAFLVISEFAGALFDPISFDL